MRVVACTPLPLLPETGTPYHLCRALAQQVEVVVVNPVVSWQKQRAIRRCNADARVQLVIPALPGQLRWMLRSFRKPLCTLWTRAVLAKYFNRAAKQPTVVWAFFSEAALWLDRLIQPKLFCYHRLDNFCAMTPEMAWLDYALMQRADLNFVVSPNLIDPQWMRPQSWIHLPNAVASEMFAAAQAPHTQVPTDLARIRPPRIGFVGTVHPDWVDLELIIALAQACPQWSWVLLGPKIRWKPPSNLPQNLYLIEARPYTQIPAYLKGMDVCIIPFRKNAISFGVSPLKLYEYLAAGKPVVSVPYFRDIDSLTTVVEVAETPKEWQGAIERALQTAQHPERIAQRMQSVASHSWETRAQVVLDALSNALSSTNTSA